MQLKGSVLHLAVAAVVNILLVLWIFSRGRGRSCSSAAYATHSSRLRKQPQYLSHDEDPAVYELRDGSWVLEEVGNSTSIQQQRGLAAADKKDWSIPALSEGEAEEAPSFCGDGMEFEPFAKHTVTGRTLERGRGTNTFFRVARPDLIDNVTRAVEEIDRSGDLDTNSYCRTFGSCDATTAADKLQSRHSKTYLVCNKQDNWIHASNILQGASSKSLPGFLADQGDTNVLCEMAKDVADIVSKLILEMNGMTNKHCIVQEQFVNQQRDGAMTMRHVHPDDTYGGLFYLDAPPGTQLCFSNSERSSRKKRWREHAPQLTENLFPGAPRHQGDDYPGFLEPRPGDVVFFPVGWLEHWVPKMTMGPDEKRTSIVFNMICI